MTKNHLKARAAPRTWNIPRKKTIFVTRPNSGGQALEMTLPLSIILKDLKLAETKKECNYIIRNTPVVVNGKRRHDVRFPVGFMDVLSLPEHSAHYTLTLDEKGRLVCEKLDAKQAERKYAQVRGSNHVRGGKLQLHLSDGSNVLVSKPITSGATVAISLDKRTVESEHPVAAKASVILTSGKHRGKRGVLESIEGEYVHISTPTGAISTKKEYAFVLGGTA